MIAAGCGPSVSDDLKTAEKRGWGIAYDHERPFHVIAPQIDSRRRACGLQLLGKARGFVVIESCDDLV